MLNPLKWKYGVSVAAHALPAPLPRALVCTRMSPVNRDALSGLRTKRSTLRAGEHVTTILSRCRCEFNQHRNPRSNNDNGGAGRAGHGQQAATALLFGFDSSNDPDHLSSDGCAYNRSIRMGFGVLDIQCGA
jgi:hypothetical protein